MKCILLLTANLLLVGSLSAQSPTAGGSLLENPAFLVTEAIIGDVENLSLPGAIIALTKRHVLIVSARPNPMVNAINLDKVASNQSRSLVSVDFGEEDSDRRFKLTIIMDGDSISGILEDVPKNNATTRKLKFRTGDWQLFSSRLNVAV